MSGNRLLVGMEGGSCAHAACRLVECRRGLRARVAGASATSTPQVPAAPVAPTPRLPATIHRHTTEDWKPPGRASWGGVFFFFLTTSLFSSRFVFCPPSSSLASPPRPPHTPRLLLRLLLSVSCKRRMSPNRSLARALASRGDIHHIRHRHYTRALISSVPSTLYLLPSHSYIQPPPPPLPPRASTVPGY